MAMQGTLDAGMLAFEKLWWLEVTSEKLKTLAEIQGNQLTSALSINVKAARIKGRRHDAGSRVTSNGPLKVIWRSFSAAGKGLLFSSQLSLLSSPPCPWAEGMAVSSEGEAPDLRKVGWTSCLNAGLLLGLPLPLFLAWSLQIIYLKDLMGPLWLGSILISKLTTLFSWA